MRKPLSLFAAASLSLGVFAYIGYDSAAFGKDDTQKSADTSGSSKDASSTSGAAGQSSSSSSGQRSSSSAYGASSSSLPQGVTKSAQADESGIRQAIAKVTADVLKEDGISQLSNCFAKNDQQRLTNLKGDQISDKINSSRRLSSRSTTRISSPIRRRWRISSRICKSFRVKCRIRRC